MFAGIIAKATGDWIQFAGSTDAGSSGSPLFNAAGEVIAMHYGAYAPPEPGQGASLLGFAIPIGRARAWLPRDARAELGL
jgi:S1-C subfamily serine protease